MLDYTPIDFNEDGNLSEWEEEYYNSIDELENYKLEAFQWEEIK